MSSKIAACIGAAIALWLVSAAQAQDSGDVARLARDVQRAQGVRDIAALNDAYAQYSQFGMWTEMADLFADKSEFIVDGKDDIKGKKAILAYFRKTYGNGKDGLAPGGMATRLQFMPTINLAADGNTGKGRWHELAFTGQYGVGAGFETAIEENDYVRENGVWKIQTWHATPQFSGPYETGWKIQVPDLKIVPYHYTPVTAGIPIPDIAADTGLPNLTGGASENLLVLSRHIQAMNDEDQVRNLQNIYGYYLDRKMWDDVTDLFALDGVYEIAGQGVYNGVPAIRSAMEIYGPQGLKHGQVFDHIMTNEVVQVMPGGHEARVRGLEFSMLGETATGKASIGLSVFENRFVKTGGIWRIHEMRVFPVMNTDYYQGWSKSKLPLPLPTAGHMPTAAAPSADASEGAVPEFFLPNPVTGRPVSYQSGNKLVANDLLLPAVAKSNDYGSLPLSEANLRLARSEAYDASVNISGAMSNYNDDFQWPLFAQTFAKDGLRGRQGSGFYRSPARIVEAETRAWGPARSPRTALPIHIRTQPVVLVSADARSAKVRTRLFQMLASTSRPGAFSGGGMYPEDVTVFEDGAWRMSNVAIEEFYWTASTWADGWARAKELTPDQTRQPPDNKLYTEFPPDVAYRDMGLKELGFAGGTGDVINFPEIKPMWFAYRNPVSGRIPEYYCDDERTCFKEGRMKINGREMWPIQ